MIAGESVAGIETLILQHCDCSTMTLKKLRDWKIDETERILLVRAYRLSQIYRVRKIRVDIGIPTVENILLMQFARIGFDKVKRSTVCLRSPLSSCTGKAYYFDLNCYISVGVCSRSISNTKAT